MIRLWLAMVALAATLSIAALTTSCGDTGVTEVYKVDGCAFVIRNLNPEPITYRCVITADITAGAKIMVIRLDPGDERVITVEDSPKCSATVEVTGKGRSNRLEWYS